MIFSKSYCPYCAKAKGIFESINEPFTVLVTLKLFVLILYVTMFFRS